MKKFNPANTKIAIVVAKFNPEVTQGLLGCAREALAEQGVREKNTAVVWVPGAYELPFVAKTLAKKKKWDAILCFGCVIKGETSHDVYVAQWTSMGCGMVSLETGVPVFFGVLTPNNDDQALARSRPGEFNRGREVAEAAIDVLKLLPTLGK